MREGGLIVRWMKMYRASADLCLQKAKDVLSFSPYNSFAPLTLKNLSGAFVILASGYLAAFLVLIAENLTFLSFCVARKLN